MDSNNLEQYSEAQLWAFLSEAQNEDKFDLLIELFERNFQSGSYIEAASFAEQASAEAELCRDSGDVENTRYKQGHALWNDQRFIEALDAFKIGIGKYEEPNSKFELYKNQWGVASCLFYLGEYRESAMWAERSTDSAVAEGDNSWAGFSKFLEAQALYLDDRESEALNACLEARGFRRVAQQLKYVADIDAYMAKIQTYLGNHHESIELLRNCLVLAESIDYKIKYFSYLLGNALNDFNEPDEARIHLERASKMYKDDEDNESLADCYFALSKYI